ncbi:SDR family oxidoreductase [Glycomyces tarimensis]
MRVFVTGATGFVGSAVVPELIEAGHEVVGLARSERAVERLAAVGAEAHRGELGDLDGLRRGAAGADGVVHLAFIHDFTDLPNSGGADLAAIEAMGEELAGTGKPLVVTAGAVTARSGTAGTEDDAVDPDSPAVHRMASENATTALAERGVRSSVVRLAASVHDRGDYGFVPALIGVAREQGVSGYVDDGRNRWPAVHRRDAARLFRFALESGTPGSRYHGVHELIPFRDIAVAIGRGLDVPVESIASADAADHFGWISALTAYDAVVSADLTRERLGWTPEHHGLLAELEAGHYFQVPAA